MHPGAASAKKAREAAGKAKATTYRVTYDQYGSATAVRAPADGVKAPADVYELLKS